MKSALPALPANGILLGAVVAAHGLNGEVKVKTFTAMPDAIARYGPLFTEDGRSFAVTDMRALKGDVVIIRFRGINDRHSAESLRGVRLYVPRATLPEPGANEFYHADLVGLRVEDGEGKYLGTVRGLHNFGAGDVIEIADARGTATFLPFTRTSVPVVDVAGKRIVAVASLESKEDESDVAG